MSLRKLGVWLLLLALIGLCWALNVGQYVNLASLKAQQASIEAYRAAYPWQAAGLYFIVYVLTAALSLPWAALLTLAGGAVFGLWWGTLLTSFASSLGATLAFLLSRYLLRTWVQQRFAQRWPTIDQGVQREGGFYLFTLRLVPIFPFFMVNLVFGLTAMRVWPFYWVSQLGMLAGTMVYVNAGTQLATIESLAGILSPTLLGSFALLGGFPWLARWLLQRWQLHRRLAAWPKPKHFQRNIIVIGGGSAGLVSAYIAAALRAKVTLIEQHKLGGDCLNTGCVPSKALLRSAKLVALCRKAPELGLHSVQLEFEFAQIMQRVRQVITQVEPHDSAERYQALGVEVIQAKAELISPWAVQISYPNQPPHVLTSRSIIVATGARPQVPELPGLAQVRYVTSDTLWQLCELPTRLLILGSGPIGLEMAQAFARLGSQVTLLERGTRLLKREDAAVAELLAAQLQSEGVQLLLQQQAVRCEVQDGQQWLITQSAHGEQRLAFDVLLLALGRVATLRGFGLERLGLADGRSLETNQFLQTRYPSIYAAGDVVGPYQLTHAAAHQAWYACVNALFSPFKRFAVDYRVLPQVVFTDPEVARVGLNEQQAQAQGIAYELSRYELHELDRAITDGATQGFIQVLTVPGRDRILGVTIVSARAGELIAEYGLAMRHGLGLNSILSTVHSYPTFAEANKYVAGVWRRAHTPLWVLQWLERLHRWQRGA